MRIALASLDQAWEDKPANLRRCRELTLRAVEQGAALIVFPEMTLTAFTMNATAIAEDATSSPTIDAFSALARELHIAIAFGVVLHGAKRPQNCLVFVDADGNEQARYAKIHPYSHSHEDVHFEPGSHVAVTALDDITFGLTICYDLRFAELYTALADTCTAVIVIASWPDARIHHWHALLTARAIECQCYVIGVNRTGEDAHNLHYPNSSCVIDPRGADVHADIVDDELALFTLDRHQVDAYRRAFPILRDRRTDLYRGMMHA